MEGENRTKISPCFFRFGRDPIWRGTSWGRRAVFSRRRGRILWRMVRGRLALSMTEAELPGFGQIRFIYAGALLPCGRATGGTQDGEFGANAFELEFAGSKGDGAAELGADFNAFKAIASFADARN